MAIVGNKSDIYQNETVKDEEVKKLANDVNAIFQRTSAKNGSGIDLLFNRLGKRFLNSDSPSIINNLSREEYKKREQKIRIEEIKNKNKNKKRCC